MHAARATKKRFRRPDGRRHSLLSADKSRSLTATRALSRIATEPPAAPPVDIEERWMQVKAPGWTLGGIALSIGLHVGMAALAFGLALQQADGIPPGAPEPSDVEVEIISANAFDSAFSEAGAAAPSQIEPASQDESAIPEIPLPEPLPPLADPELMPIPAPIPDSAEMLAQDIRETAAPPEPTQIIPPESSPSLSEPPPDVARPSSPEKAEKVQPAEKARTPARAAPRPAKARMQPKAEGETGNGRDAASTHSASRGSHGQSGTVGTGAFAGFRSRVIAHLARYKRYPDAARIQQMRGRVLVTFSLDAGGRVTGVSLAAPSSHPLLDAEALTMVRRASPFPAIPPETGQGSASFTAPIVYDMN